MPVIADILAKKPESTMNKKNLPIATGLIIIAAFIGAAIFQTEQPSQDNDNTIDTLTMPERKNAPSKGPNDAKVTIVEFFDPACETCAIFHPFVNSLIEQHPGKVKVVMRYAPFHRGSNGSGQTPGSRTVARGNSGRR